MPKYYVDVGLLCMRRGLYLRLGQFDGTIDKSRHPRVAAGLPGFQAQ